MPVEVEKIIYVKKPFKVETIREVEVEKIIYVDKPYEVEVEMIVYECSETQDDESTDDSSPETY
jgi:hypothetical protein